MDPTLVPVDSPRIILRATRDRRVSIWGGPSIWSKLFIFSILSNHLPALRRCQSLERYGLPVKLYDAI